MKNGMKYVVIVMFISGVWQSCKKYVNIPPPPTRSETIKIFENESSAVAAATGVYSKIMQSQNMLSGSNTIYAALGSDELTATAPNSTIDAFRTNSLLAGNATLPVQYWTGPYNLVYHANVVMEGLQHSVAISDSLRNQLTGEMLVARSLVYFYLVNLFGDVPFITTTDYRVNALMPRTDKQFIYDRLIEDLITAEHLLKPEYPSANRFRPNSYTALALLSRIYLYTGKNELAVSTAGLIINSGRYALAALAAVFPGSGSPETIWAMVRDNGNTFEAGQFVPSSTTARPLLVLTPELLASFETSDQRKLVTGSGWLGKNSVSGIDYYYPAKYKLRTLATGSAPTEFMIVFRLAEQWLIRAEARLNNSDLSGAIQDINIVRQRAGLPAYPLSLNATQVRAAIKQERRVEFFCEWGHRWLDLKRYGDADAVLAPLKGSNWQSTDVLYPIPGTELQTNPFLIQNPGY